MTTRRDFIGGMTGAMAGVAFVGCELMHTTHAHAQPAPQAPRGGGERPPREDRRCARALRLPGRHGLDGPQGESRNPGHGHRAHQGHGRAGHRRRGAEHQPVLVQGRPRPRRARSIKLQNEKLAELCAAQPDRFVAFAPVALQHPDLAAEQLDDAVKKLGLRGAAIGGSVERRGARRSRSSIRSGPRRRSSAA